MNIVKWIFAIILAWIIAPFIGWLIVIALLGLPFMIIVIWIRKMLD
jgi:hypothetical protein